jgi:ferritin-like metal-binding protein YciE
MPEKDLSDLFVDTLKDIYYAEKQIYKSLLIGVGSGRRSAS